MSKIFNFGATSPTKADEMASDADMNRVFKWELPVRPVPPQPSGKLMRAHHLGDERKVYMDEIGHLFEIDFRSGNKIHLGQVWLDKK